MSGRSVQFHTAVAVLRADVGFERCELAPVTVRFRDLSEAEIEHYLRLEQPYDGPTDCDSSA